VDVNGRKNTPAYYEAVTIMSVKSFVVGDWSKFVARMEENQL
jgi:hypothetical protein